MAPLRPGPPLRLIATNILMSRLMGVRKFDSTNDRAIVPRAMSWLFFAFYAPWAVSVDLDKYLLECYFKNTGFSILMIFAATFARLVLPALWVLRPNVVAIDAVDDCAVAASGVPYMGVLYPDLQALKAEEASVVAPFFQALGMRCCWRRFVWCNGDPPDFAVRISVWRYPVDRCFRV
jgi:hypothetical protein